MTELDWLLAAWCVLGAFAAWLLMYLVVDYLRMARTSRVIVRIPQPERRHRSTMPTPLYGERR